MSRLSRQKTILELIRKEPVANQEHLRRLLDRGGISVTQATLSRDIAKLGLVKTADGYAARDRTQPAPSASPSAARVVRDFVVGVREAQNLLVIKTALGSAQPVAAAVDAAGWPEVVGTIAGDDTVLLVSPSQKSAQSLASRLRTILR
jgi:transcriptional regulator of arginine metabolism